MKLPCFAAVISICASVAFGQTASLSGRIFDSSGAVVPSAKVELRSPAGPNLSTASGADGLYSFTGLTPGSYSVTAAANQLSLSAPARIALRAGQQTLNLELAVTATAQHTTVQDDTAPTASVDSAATAGATVISGGDLRSLSDDPEDLQADLIALAGPSAGPGDTEILIDGFSYGQLPPKESIREVRINENPFSPEYDKVGLGRVEVFTKPGASRFRGAAVYNSGVAALNSRNPYASQRAPFLLQESENNLTGPLSKTASLTLDAGYEVVDDGSITNAVTLAPATLAPTAFNSVVSTPQHRVRFAPRLDYQLSRNNFLSLRYSLMPVNIRDAGIGSFDLISRGYSDTATYNTIQLIDTALHGSTVNETRILAFHWHYASDANTDAPQIRVLGAFNGGGASDTADRLTQQNYEFQNNTYIVRGAHSWRFGVRVRAQTTDSIIPFNFQGTFTFTGALAPALDANNQPVPGSSIQISSIEQYRRTVLGLPGGGASLYTVSAGNPLTDVYQVEPSAFTGDDWRLKPNLTLSLGFRFESQNNINDRADYAPRLGFAWAPDGRANKPGKTVIRGGFGIFYDRFILNNTLIAKRYDGIVQQQYIVTDPGFFLTVPSVAQLAALSPEQTIREVDSHARSPYLMQSVIAVERQLSKTTTLAVTYSNSHGLHEPRTEDINPPEPGTYSGSGTGVYPYPGKGPIYLITTSGLYNQNQLIANLNSRLTPAISLFSSYTLNRAMSNTDGVLTYPGNPYNYSGEYGPANTDIRHRFQLGGSIDTFWRLSLNPLVMLQSGAPFNITTGEDPYGTNLFFARPGIATDPNKPGVIQTSYGLLDPNPSRGEPIIGRNAGRGPGLISVNLRVSRVWGFGPERTAARTSTAPGVFSNSPSTRKYNLTLGISGRNILNHTNPGPIVGIVTSPLFGSSNQIAGYNSTDPAGFTENASNRRLEMQVRVSF